MRVVLKLLSSDHKQLDEVCKQIKELLLKMGVDHSGPIPLPTRRIVIPVKKSPCGNGTIKWDRWEMRIHKRLFHVQPDERAMRQITRLSMPDTVRLHVEVRRS